ncbi:hypothetical protein [Aurantiacibacter sp. MUD61]|uniref:hypothetical protein n=1 Tax=Aurantiacibacter sp. MUD61 TaxID=3009083 RepID=UPI0022F0C618|nr:hypothetical protein [Aurantiacibacter sp. MUD61]
MKKIAPLLLPILALAACGEEPAPEPTSEAAPAVEETVELPAPDQALFASLLAEQCPGAEPVNTAVCSRAMGADEAVCEYGLGDDEYLRNAATIAVNEGGDAWMLTEGDAVCPQ